jgi:RimJ/RimL family protein N-acetyltransferase
MPSVLRTQRLFLRPWRADDGVRLHPVLTANHAYLSPWIPAHIADPASQPLLAQRLAAFGADFAAAREWRYAMLTSDATSVLGELSLFPRDAKARVPYQQADRVELGYWLREDATGRGLVTEAVREAVRVVAMLPQFVHAEIRCDAGNEASAAIPERLGFVLAELYSEAGPPEGVELQRWTLRLRPDAAAGTCAAP